MLPCLTNLYYLCKLADSAETVGINLDMLQLEFVESHHRRQKKHWHFCTNIPQQFRTTPHLSKPYTTCFFSKPRISEKHMLRVCKLRIKESYIREIELVPKRHIYDGIEKSTITGISIHTISIDCVEHIFLWLSNLSASNTFPLVFHRIPALNCDDCRLKRLLYIDVELIHIRLFRIVPPVITWALSF